MDFAKYERAVIPSVSFEVLPEIFMNKLTFDLNGNAISDRYTVSGHYHYEKDYEGKKSVLSFTNAGNSLKIPESQIQFDGESDYLEFNFRVDSAPRSEVTLVNGNACPFTLRYYAKDDGIHFHTELITEHNGTKYIRECKSPTPLALSTWYNIKIIFIHEEYCILVDNQPHLRRIYKGEWWDYAPKNLVFSGEASTRLCDIAISENIFDEVSAASVFEILEQMNDDDFMELECCLQDCAADGIFMSAPASRPFIDGKSCWVNIYGGIVFDYEDKPIYLPIKLFQYYKDHLAETGRPVAYTSYTCKDDKSLIEFALFVNEGVFYNANKKTITVLDGDILTRFLNCDLTAYNNWYPVSVSSFTSLTEIKYVEFSNKLVIYAFNDQTILLSASFHEYLRDGKKLLEAGLPVDDYRIGVDGDGNKCYEALECQNGTFHTTNTFKNFFSDQKLGAPVKLYGKKEVPGVGTIRYYDFENGVIVHYPSQKEPIVHTGIKLRFRNVTSGKIDDGINSTAELYMKFSLYENGRKIVDNVQLGQRSYPGSSNYVWGASYNNYTLSPLSGSSSFRIVIRLYDYDPESGDDYLGSFDYTYSIANGWGIDPFDGKETTMGIHDLPMTAEGRDNRKGLGNNRLRLTLGETYDMEELMKDIRKNFTLPFENFTGAYSFSEERFTNIFTNANKFSLGFLSYLLHPLDALFYGICSSALDGAKCFGFATTELLATHDLGPFIPPLKKYTAKKNYDGTYYTLSPLIADPICDHYLYQCGWDFMMWQWRRMNANEYLIAHSAIESIVRRLSEEKFCLIDIKHTDMNGHALLGYDFKKISPSERLANGKYPIGGIEIKADYDYLIYVADSNRPYRSGDADDTYSFIAFEKENAVRDRVDVYYMDNGRASKMGYDAYHYIFETPFSVISKPPRVPNIFDILVDSITNMVAGWFEASVDKVQIVDSNTNEVLFDREKGILKSKRIMVFQDMAADGKNRHTRFILKGNDVSFKFRGSKRDNIGLHIGGRETNASFKTDLTPGEELDLTLRNIHRPVKFSTDIRSSLTAKNIQSEISFVDRRDKDARNVFAKTITTDRGKAKLTTFNAGSRMKINGSTAKSLRQRISMSTTRLQEVAVRRNYPGALIMNKKLTINQISHLFNVSETTARRYCRKGLLEGARKVNGKWTVPAENKATK